jgi:serine/threonine protein kinase
MHACDMIHHDLKPQNILLHATTNNGNARGGTDQTPVITCLISDFGTSEALKGIAVTAEQDAEQRNNHLGTLEWLAPEVVRETINSSSPESASAEIDRQGRMSGDIWSLGMILYFMLCKYVAQFA